MHRVQRAPRLFRCVCVGGGRVDVQSCEAPSHNPELHPVRGSCSQNGAPTFLLGRSVQLLVVHPRRVKRVASCACMCVFVCCMHHDHKDAATGAQHSHRRKCESVQFMSTERGVPRS